MFSDNCAVQFRSKFTVANLCYLADDLVVELLTWDTFASGHGKGAVDAVGGNLKRMVWLLVKSRQVRINTAKEYFEFAAKKAKKICVLWVPSTDVEGSSPMLTERWKKVLELKGIQNFHHFERVNETSISAACTVKSSKDVFQLLPQPRIRLENDASDNPNVYSSSLETKDQNGSNPEKLEKIISSGSFVKLQLADQSNVINDYFGVCKTNINKQNTVKVLFFKVLVDDDPVSFKNDSKNLKFVDFNAIVKILPKPNIKKLKNKIIYEFPKSVL